MPQTNQVPTGEPVAWVQTGEGLAGASRARWLPMAVFVVVFLVLLVVIAASSARNSGAFVVPLFEVLVFGGLLVALVYTAGSRATRAVGVWRGGVILRRRSGDVAFAWNQLQPGMTPGQRGAFWFQSVSSGGQTNAMGGFLVTREQARAIVLSPFAPPWLLSPLVSGALGVPSQRVSNQTAPAPPLPPPTAPGPTSGAAATPVWSAPPPSGASPYSTAPPTYPTYPPPPAYTPSAAPLPSSRPTAPAPGMILCPRCGQANPIGRTAFCQACGQRLPRT